MPRKALATTAPAESELDPTRLQEAQDASTQLSHLQQNYDQGRDLVNQLLGQAQALNAAGDLLRTFGISKLAIVKENKLFHQLSGMSAPNGSALKGTWEEFCGLLGMSRDKADTDIANLKAFGEEALEAMQRAGMGYRELRQFRKLPADQKTALIEAAKEGDKTTLLELAEDLIAKHAKEKADLTEKVQSLQADAEAVDHVLEDRQRRITNLERQVHKKIGALTDWPEAFAPLLDQIAAARRQIDKTHSDLGVIIRTAIQVTPQPGEEASLEAAFAAVAQALQDTYVQAANLLEEGRLFFGQTLEAYKPEQVIARAATEGVQQA